MVNVSQLEEDRARASAGISKNNVIVHPKVMRKALLKIYYAKEVDIIMKAVCSCDMKKPEPKFPLTKVGKGIYVNGDLDLANTEYDNEIPIG